MFILLFLLKETELLKSHDAIGHAISSSIQVESLNHLRKTLEDKLDNLQDT